MINPAAIKAPKLLAPGLVPGAAVFAVLAKLTRESMTKFCSLAGFESAQEAPSV